MAEVALRTVISAVDRMSPVLKKISHAAGRLNESMHTLGRAGSTLRDRLGVPIALLGTATVAAIGHSVSAYMELGGALSDASKKTGMAVEKLQALRYAAQLAGVAPEALDNALAKLNVKLREAGTGGDRNLLQMLNRMGVRLRDAHGKTRQLADIMPELAESISKQTDPTLRAAMAQELFGKSGAELLPMLLDGSKGMAEAEARARKLGIVMSEDAVSAADDLGDSLDTLKLAGRGLGNTIGAKLAPILQPLITKLTEWISRNRELIATRLESFVDRISTALQTVDWKAVETGLTKFWQGVEKVVGWMGGWDNAILVFVGIANADLLVALGSILKAVLSIGPAIWQLGSALVGLVAANPVIAAIVVVVGLLAMAAVWVYRNWDKVRGFFDDFWHNMGRLTGRVIGWVIGGFLRLGQSIIHAVGAAWDWITSSASDMWNGLKKTFSDIVDWFVLLWNDPGKAVDQFLAWVTDLFTGWWKSLKEWGQGIADWFSGLFEGIQEGLDDTMSDTKVTSQINVNAGKNMPAAGQQRLNGELKVTFSNAPPGLRVEPGKTNQPGMAFNPAVGYRSTTIGAR